MQLTFNPLITEVLIKIPLSKECRVEYCEIRSSSFHVTTVYSDSAEKNKAPSQHRFGKAAILLQFH